MFIHSSGVQVIFGKSSIKLWYDIRMKSYYVPEYHEQLRRELHPIDTILDIIQERIRMMDGINASHYSIEHQKLYAWLADVLQNQYHTAFLHDIKEEEKRIFDKIQLLHHDEYFFDMEEKRVHQWINEHTIIIERYQELQKQYIRQKQLLQELKDSPPTKYIAERNTVLQEAKRIERFESLSHYDADHVRVIHEMNMFQRWWYYRKSSPSTKKIFDLSKQDRIELLHLLNNNTFDTIRHRYHTLTSIIEQYHATCQNFQMEYDNLAHVIHDFQLTHEEFLLEYQGYNDQLRAIHMKKNNIRQGILRLKQDSSNAPERIVQRIFDTMLKAETPTHYPELYTRYKTYKERLEQETELYLGTIESMKHLWMAHQESWEHYKDKIHQHIQELNTTYQSHSDVSKAQCVIETSWKPVASMMQEYYHHLRDKDIHEKPVIETFPNLHFSKKEPSYSESSTSFTL